MKFSKFFVTCFCIAILSIGAFSDASAQIVPSTRPQPVQVRDRFGIDLPSGKMIYSSPEITIGPSKIPSLAFTPVTNTGLFASEYTPQIGSMFLYSCGGAEGCGEDYFQMWLDGATISFPRTYNVSAGLTGETLIENNTNHYIVYQKDGSVIHFSKISIPPISGQQVFEVGHIQKITYADGRIIEYSQSALGERIIASSDGYIYYQSGGVRKLVNRLYTYCAVGPSNCSTTAAWPKYDINGDALNIKTIVNTVYGTSSSITTITRPSGLVETISQNQVSMGPYPPLNLIITTSYSSQIGSASYTYDGNTVYGITKTTSTRPNGKYVEYLNSRGTGGALTDEIGREFVHSYNSFPTYGWSYNNTASTLNSMQSPELSRQEWDYDSHGNVIVGRALAKPTTGLLNISVSQAFPTSCTSDYRACYRLTYSIDANGNRTDFEYDAASGLVSKSIAPADASGIRATTRYTYQQMQASYIQTVGGSPTLSGKPIWKMLTKSTCRSVAAPACVGTNDETVVTYAYDSNLQPISETTKSGTGTVLSVVTRAFDYVGNVSWEDGPASGTGDRVYFFHDAGRRQIGMISPTSPANLAIRIFYNDAGGPTLVQKGTVAGVTKADLDAIAPFQEVVTAYDGISRKIREDVRPYGGASLAVTQFSYDGDGNLECTAVRMNPAVFGSLPTSACALGTQGANGPDRITKNLYDAVGQLLQVKHALGTPLEQNYATYTYSRDGRQKTVVDAKGNRAEMFYDGFDRQIAWAFPRRRGQIG